MKPSEGSRLEALNLVLQLARHERGLVEDRRISEAIPDELVAAVFEAAWVHQWDRDDREFLRAVGPLVDASVKKAVDE